VGIRFEQHWLDVLDESLVALKLPARRRKDK